MNTESQKSSTHASAYREARTRTARPQVLQQAASLQQELLGMLDVRC